MYKKIILCALLSLAPITIFGTKDSSLPNLPGDIQKYIALLAIDKDGITHSIRTLRLVNKHFYNALTKASLNRDAVITMLAHHLAMPPRAIALHIVKACKLNKEEAQDLLRKYPANKELGQRLISAVWSDDVNLIQQLLKQNADINAQNDVGMIALMHSTYRGRDKEIAELLLKHGADVNAQSSDSWTALMKAAHWGHKDIVELLLKHGAHVTVKNNNNKTALDIAKAKTKASTTPDRAMRQNYKDIVELLEPRVLFLTLD